MLAVICAGILAGTGQAGSTGVGTLIGLAQWLITGVALGRYPSRHPLVQAGGVGAPISAFKAASANFASPTTAASVG